MTEHTTEGTASHGPQGTVHTDARRKRVVMTWPCARGDRPGARDAVYLSPADARHLATLLLGSADKLEPPS
jgi:hypothetical protein